MRFAAAQIKANIGDLKGNLSRHIRIIELARENKVDLIVFPEMSLTGYCREEASKLAFTKDDVRLNILKELASKNKMTIIVGAPIHMNHHLYIGSFIIQPDAPMSLYTKQFLHDGEELFFKNDVTYNPIVKIENEIIQFAICADINCEQHALNASKNNTTFYIPSIFFSKNGIENGHKILENYAKKYRFHILMSNFTGEHWDVIGGGKSAFWNDHGEKLKALNIESEGLLMVEKTTEIWNVKSIQA